MKLSHITLVQHAFAQLAPDADPFANLLYARLFQLDPSLRALFPNDLREQRNRLIKSLVLVVNHLDDSEIWLPLVSALGRRHVECGIEPKHYETFGLALLWTAQQALGEAFTPDMREAWLAVYTELAAAMHAGAQA